MGLGGRPGGWQHCVERARKTLENAETADACGHGAESDSGEGGGRDVAYRYNGNNDKGIFK